MVLVVSQLLFLFLKVDCATLLLPLSHDQLHLRVSLFWRVVGALAVVIDCASLLAVVVIAFLLRPLLLHQVLVVLGSEVAFELAELSLDFVLAVLANHLDGPKAFLSLAQFVLLLLIWTSLFRKVNALVDATTVSLADSKVYLMPSFGTSSGGAAGVHHSEAFGVHESVMNIAPWRSLCVPKN